MNPTLSRVLAGLVAAVAFNWLSTAFPVAAPTAILLSFIALVLLVAVDSPSLREEVWARNLRRRGWIGLARFTLTSVLLGAATAAVWLVPLWKTAAWSFRLRILENYGLPPSVFYNFEVGAASVLGGLALIAALRGAPATSLCAFVLGTTGGMALTLTSLRSDQMFGLTWLSWTLAIGSVVALVKAIPDVRRDFSSFFRGGVPRAEGQISGAKTPPAAGGTSTEAHADVSETGSGS